jgi:protein phosphatase
MLVHGLSHPGNSRTNNEDFMLWDTSVGFVSVADGMGGHQAGEVASRVASEAALGFIGRSAAGHDFTWPFGVNPRVSMTANRLMTAMRLANRRVHRHAEEAADYVGMGTTLSIVVQTGPSVAVASVGDSRVYAFRNDRLDLLTEDDSWASMLAKQAGVTPEKARQHPMRHVLTSVVGAKPDLDVEVIEMEAGDYPLLLSSDGLHGVLDDDQIARILRETPDPASAAAALIEAALAADGSHDNITAVIVTFGP